MLAYDNDRQRLWRVLMVVLLFQLHNSIRTLHYLHHPAIVSPSDLPWQRLYEQADPSLFLHMTGLTQQCFVMLLYALFDPEEILPHQRCRHKRPRSLQPEGCLGLLLFYLGSTMNHKHLCMISGIVPGVCSKVVCAMLRLAVRRLADNPIAEVRFPSAEKMRRFSGMVQSREPLVDDLIGFMDGVSIPAECTDERFEQNAFYCGYDCDTMVNNVFAYGPDGKVFFAAVNFPGSWADGMLTARFLHALKNKIGEYKICVDQGFPRSGEAYGTLVGPVTKRAARRLHQDVREYLLRISNVHTLLRQASKWGMHGLQGTFPRWKKRLPSNHFQQRLVIEAIVLIHNYHTELVGFNQISTVFDSEYVHLKNLEGYDRIAQYYFRPCEYNSDDNEDGNSVGSDEEM
jgi:hypothetical protein